MNWRQMGAVVALVGCSVAQAALFDDEEARARINSLSGRVDQIQRALDQRIGTLETAVRNQTSLDLIAQIEQLRGDIARLRGQIEVMTHDLEQAQKRQRDLYVDLDSRLRRLETLPRPEPKPEAKLESRPEPKPEPKSAPVAGAPAAGTGAPVGVPATAAPSPVPPSSASGATPAIGSPIGSAQGGAVMLLPPSPPVGGAPPAAARAEVAPGVGPPPGLPPTPRAAAPAVVAIPGAADTVAEQRAYDAALDLFRGGSYPASIDGFRSFIRNHPRSPLAPSAQYWIGNAQYAMRDYRAAMASQRQLLASYPDSQKVPDALLNIASCQAELGERAAARRTLEDVAATYPTSDAARIARQRLPALR